jgi:hypothetical protein
MAESELRVFLRTLNRNFTAKEVCGLEDIKKEEVDKWFASKQSHDDDCHRSHYFNHPLIASWYNASPA